MECFRNRAETGPKRYLRAKKFPVCISCKPRSESRYQEDSLTTDSNAPNHMIIIAKQYIFNLYSPLRGMTSAKMERM